MTLDIRSQRRLHGVEPSLVKVFELAAQRSPVPFQITEGRRDAKRQKQLVAKGASQTMKSRHLHGGAVDFHVLNQDGTANWDFDNYKRVWNEAILPAAQELGVEVEWGGDWKSLRDGPHIQLKRSGGQTQMASATGQTASGSTAMTGGGGESALLGGASRDDLFAEALRRGLVTQGDIAAEAKRRGLTLPGQQMQPDPRDRADAEYAVAQMNGQRLPDPRDRADVENALNQLAMQSTLPPKSKAEGVFDEFTSGVVGNFGDELTAVERAIPALFDDRDFVEQYQIALSEERERSRQFAEDNSTLATGANIAGAVATGLGAAKKGVTLLGAGVSSVPKAVALGGAEGALYGAIWGAGASEGDFDKVVDDAIASGALGGILGGTIAGGLQKIANSSARGAAVKALKPTADLKVARDQAYDAVTALGASYNAGAVDNLVNRMGHQLRSRAFNEKLHTGAAAAMEYANSLKGRPLTLTEVDQLRQIIARDAGNSNVPADKMFAEAMIDEIDDFIMNTAPRGGQSRGQTARAMRDARAAHATFKKTELIDNLLLQAADQAASTGSGGNVNNAIRQKFRSLLNNKKQIKFFNSEEVGAMRRIVRGSTMDNTLRLIGKLSPGGNGLMTALNLGAVAVNPAMIGVSAAGAGAKALADRGTQKAVQGVQTTVQSGANSRTAQGNVTPEARALFRTLATMLGLEVNLEDAMRPTTQAQ